MDWHWALSGWVVGFSAGCFVGVVCARGWYVERLAKLAREVMEIQRLAALKRAEQARVMLEIKGRHRRLRAVQRRN